MGHRGYELAGPYLAGCNGRLFAGEAFRWKALSLQRGSTLIEAVIAVLILGTAVTAIFALMVHNLAVMRRTDEYLYVDRVLESTLEATRALSFEEVEDWQTSQSGVIDFATAYPITNIYGQQLNPGVTDEPTYGLNLRDGSGRVFIDDVGNPAEELKKITIQVTWRPYGHAQALPAVTHEIVTYMSRFGIKRSI
jgi:hypothetical protein